MMIFYDQDGNDDEEEEKEEDGEEGRNDHDNDDKGDDDERMSGSLRQLWCEFLDNAKTETSGLLPAGDQFDIQDIIIAFVQHFPGSIHL